MTVENTDITPELLKRIYAKRVDLVYENTGPALIGNVLVALLGVVVLSPILPSVVPWIWLAVFLMIVAARWSLKLYRDRRLDETEPRADVWGRRLFVAVTLNGIWWGVFCALLISYAGPLQLGFAPFIIGGLVAAAVATLGAIRSVYLGFTIPMIAWLIGALLVRGDVDSMVMAGFAMAFEVTLIGTVWRVSDIVGRDIELKLQNDRLVLSLTAANAQLASANLSLGHEVEERKRAEARSEFLATHDALTGLPNRRMQHDRFAQAAARVSRGGGLAAILFIDLDNFKNVNDRLGHGAGDELLRAVADRLRDCLRLGDSVCRHGGDEFLLLIGDATDRLAVTRVAERVIASMLEPVLVEGEQIRIGCSIGISLYPADGDHFDLLVSHADKALYQVKRQGRGRYRFFEADRDLHPGAAEACASGSLPEEARGRGRSA